MGNLSSLTLSELETLLYSNGDPRHFLLDATFPSAEAAPLGSPEGAVQVSVAALRVHIRSLQTEVAEFDSAKDLTRLLAKVSAIGRVAEDVARGVSSSSGKSREAELESRLERMEKLATLLAREFGEVLLASPEVLNDVLPEPPELLKTVDAILPPSLKEASLLLKHPHVKQVVDHLREKFSDYAVDPAAAPAPG